MKEMFAAAEVMMQPYDAKSATMRLSSIVDKGDGKPVVDWSDSYMMTAYAKGASIELPDGIVSTPGSIILAEVVYEHDSKLGGFLKSSRTISDKFYLRPRRVDEITRVTKGGSPFGPTS